MPELPEVETVRRGLQSRIVGRRVTAINVLTDKTWQSPQSEIPLHALGATITGTRRRAKVLIIDLDNGYSFMFHLKMTGQLIFRIGASVDAGGENWGGGHPTESFVGDLPDRSTRVQFDLGFLAGETAQLGLQGKSETGESREASAAVADPKTTDLPQSTEAKEADKTPHLFFNDQRKFGWIKLLPSDQVLEQPFLTKLGPEIVDFTQEKLAEKPSPAVNKEFIARARHHQNSPVKAVILDQEVIAGIGNIYADEALWGAKIHPATKLKDLSDAQLRRILLEAKISMGKSLEAGGSTMQNYVQPDGSRGNYLDLFANVFRREGQPCKRCGTTIVKIRVAGRGTHVCPKCQPYPYAPETAPESVRS